LDARAVRVRRPAAWLSPLVRELAIGIMTRINAAACVTPINLIGLVLLATPRQSMGEADLARQLELYASLMRQAPYSPRVWITTIDGAAMIRYGESMGILRRQPHELGDVVFMTEEHSVLTSYFRNNALHLLLMPSLLACAFLSNPSVPRADLQRLARRVYPYVADEYFLRWTEQELPAVVDELLEDLLNHGCSRLRRIAASGTDPTRSRAKPCSSRCSRASRCRSSSAITSRCRCCSRPAAAA